MPTTRSAAPRRACALRQLLLRAPPAFVAGQENPRRVLLREPAGDSTGSLLRVPLIKPSLLFSRAEPPLFHALLLLSEAMTWLSGLGVLAVTGGVFLIAGGPGQLANAHDPAQRVRVRAGLPWGAFTGLAIAGYTLIDGCAGKAWLASPLLVGYLGNFRIAGAACIALGVAGLALG